MLKLKESKYKNFNFVKVKAERVCKHCGTIINKSTKALTVNKKEKRYWVCLGCVNKFISSASEKANAIAKCLTIKYLRDNVAFGDDGAWLAYNDAYAEECAELLEKYDIDL